VRSASLNYYRSL